jgi:DNA-binding response OmpR family regulator
LLERALLNLIGNAVKFTDRGRILVSAVALKDAVRISVQDSGAGVPADKQSQLFHRYPLGARAARKGAGLGLYLTRLIVDLHGGALRHNAPASGGAEFIIDLKPAPDGAELEQPELAPDRYYAEALGSDAVGPEPISPPESSAPADSERPRLLIVEDEPELSAALIQLFSDRYVVLHAENGRRGYEVALQFSPDAVVADVLMPESSGLEMLERMRASESLRGTPVLLLTARADAASRRRGLDLGAEDYVAKPFDPRELELRVRNLVERKLRAKNAVDRMRERMFADFHDYLGAPLTDLNHIVDRLEREGGLPAERLEQLRESVRRTHWSFRNLLETSDDLRILERDFLYGLHLTLLRRYAALNREFRLSIDPDLSRSLQGASLAGLKATLHVTALELTTNDLKYGDGPSTWEIRTAEDDGEMLELAMEAATRYAAEPGRRGRGGANIIQRAAEIGGTANLRVANGRFYAQIRLPLDARARKNPGR